MIKLNDKVYNYLKWGIMILLPAVSVFISGLGASLGFDTEVIVTILNLSTAFLGAITGISTINYKKTQEKEEK